MTSSDWRYEFDDIRPYTDEEMPTVLKRISRNPWLISGIRRMRLPNCPQVLKPIVNKVIELDLRRTLRRVESVDDFQRRIIVDRVLHYVVRKTSHGFTWSGADGLERGGAYLFMSNHRDIVLDSALLNYALAKSDLDIAEIAFGDNLLTNQFVTDLIRVNKSFVVRRSVTVREKARAAFQLSKYIQTTRSHANSVWIAQREGRSKDGTDTTNPSILKMLYFNAKSDGMSFSEYLSRYPLIPVAVSYEFDPCDRFKARELLRRRRSGTYEKRKSEDLISMYTGLKGEKGRIHLSFGSAMQCGTCDFEEAAAEMDRRIHQLYRLWPSNYIAYDILHETNEFGEHYTTEQRDLFRRRLEKESPAVGRVMCEIYANPVTNSVRGA